MSDDLIELVITVRAIGPLRGECVDLLRRDLERMTRLTGTGDNLSAARVIAVREGIER